MGVHVPSTPWFLPLPGDGSQAGGLARGKRVNAAVRGGGTLPMFCVLFPSSSESLHSRRGWGLTGSTQGFGGLFQWLLKKAGGGLDEGEQMVWGGCSYTRLEKSSLPCTSLMQAAQAVANYSHALFGVFLYLFCVPVWDTNLFYCDALPPHFIASECLPHEEPRWSPWMGMIIFFLLALVSPVPLWVCWTGMYRCTSGGKGG